MISRCAAAFLFLFSAYAIAEPADQGVPGLTAKETANIRSRLKKFKPATLTIACAGQHCRRLGDDVAKVFGSAGWKVVRMNKGGLGIDGVAGLRIHPCGADITKTIKALAATVPNRKVEVIHETCAPNDNRDVFLIIGQ